MESLANWIRGIWILLGLCVVGSAALVAMGVEAELTLIVGGVLAVSCVIALPIFYFFGRKYRQAIAELLAGNHWVRWQYDPVEWEHERRVAVGLPSAFPVQATKTDPGWVRFGSAPALPVRNW